MLSPSTAWIVYRTYTNSYIKYNSRSLFFSLIIAVIFIIIEIVSAYIYLGQAPRDLLTGHGTPHKTNQPCCCYCQTFQASYTLRNLKPLRVITAIEDILGFIIPFL